MFKVKGIGLENELEMLVLERTLLDIEELKTDRHELLRKIKPNDLQLMGWPYNDSRRWRLDVSYLP